MRVQKLASVEDIPGGAQITTELTFDEEGAGEEAVCVASRSRAVTSEMAGLAERAPR